MLNVHIYPSTFEYETRILKVTDTLVENKIVDRVMIIAKAGPNLSDEEKIDGHRYVCRVGTHLTGGNFWLKTLRFVEWSTRILQRLRHEDITMINCHSLSVLPLCTVIKFWHRAILVYEPHELETETATFIGFRKKIAKRVERALIGQAERVIVVSESIAEYYRNDYGITEVPVIMNTPKLNAAENPNRSAILREHFSIPENHLIFMYQGALEEERGILVLLEAFVNVSHDRHLVFMGFGSLQGKIRLYTRTHPNIHLHPAVKPADVMRYTLGADIGFALLNADCLNHQCALPNKLFHYLHAGLPVIVSNLVEMRTLVKRYKCGWSVDNTSEALAKRVESIGPDEITTAKSGSLQAREQLHWGNEAIKLVATYNGLLRPSV